MESFHDRVIGLIGAIPEGMVATYGQIAAMAGNPRGARQVARTLHSSSRKERLPWHRVINSRGMVSLPRGGGYELQRSLLEGEGVEFGITDTVDLTRYRWEPVSPEP